jgi:lipoprotein-anchoring transpeptidase ErfK/SrfK
LTVTRKKRKIHLADKFQIIICIADQKLYLYKQGKLMKTYRVSTSRYGIGNRNNSFKTPLGRHLISSKIGRKARLNSIFQDRRNTKKTARIGSDFDKDLITTRILRLEGLEPGKNKGKGIDTFDRCIYIHGTAEEHLVGKPASHGCIRMKNKDIAELFDLVPRGTVVDIKNS